MTASRRSLSKGPARLASIAALSTACILSGAASANEQAERVRGYFCTSKADQIAFLKERARGENEIMAAEAVNKSIAKASCTTYLPLQAIPGEEQTIFADGLVFKVQKFVFLPERSEHWAGAVMGSLNVSARDQNI